MGYFSHYKRDPKTRFAAKYQRFFSLFLKIFVQFQAFKNLYNPKKQENMRKYEKTLGKKEFRFRKKRVSAPIPIPKLDLGFGFR